MNERLRIGSGFDDGLREFDRAVAALGKAVADGKAHAELGRTRADHFDFGVFVRMEVVERNDDVGPEVLEVFNVCFEIAEAALQSFHVGLADFRQRHAAVPLEGLR